MSVSGRNKEDRRDESKVVKKVEKEVVKEVENDVYSVGTGSLFTLKRKKKEKEKEKDKENIGSRTECGKQFI